jgi:hypothetical protein
MLANGRPATRERLTSLALATIEEAIALANLGPVEPHAGYRLALGWLAHIGVATDVHCFSFWTEMRAANNWAPTAASGHAHRVQILSALSEIWYYELGIELPKLVQRGDLKRRIIARRGPISTPD